MKYLLIFLTCLGLQAQGLQLINPFWTSGGSVTTSNLLLYALGDYFPLESASGGSSTGSHASKVLTEGGTVTDVTGIQGNAAQFDSGDYLTIADDTTFEPNYGDFTMTCWVNLSTLSGSKIIVSKWVFAGNQKSYSLEFTDGATDDFRIYFSVDGSAVSATAIHTPASAIATNTWYFLAVRYNAAADNILFSATASTSSAIEAADTPVTFAGPIYNSTAPFRIGESSGGVIGIVDEVLFTKAWLNDYQLNQLFRARNETFGYAQFDNTSRGSTLGANVVVAYNLDETSSSSNADDVGPNNLDATANSSPNVVEGINGGTALNIGGRQNPASGTRYFNRADNAAFTFGGEFSVSTWAKPAVVAAGQRYLFGKSGAGVSEWYVLRNGTSSYFFTTVNTTPSGFNSAGSTAPSIDRWNFILGRYDSSPSFLQNTIVWTPAAVSAQGTASPSGTLGDGTADFTIFRLSNIADYFEGSLDNVAVFNRYLTDGERIELYNNGAGYPYPFTFTQNGLLQSLLAYYRCEETAATNSALTDWWAGNDLTANNGLSFTNHGKLDIARLTDDAADYFSRTDDADFEPDSGAYTIIFWVYPGASTRNYFLVAKDNVDGWGVLQKGGSGTAEGFAVQAYDSAGNYFYNEYVTNTYPDIDLRWSFVAAQFDGSNGIGITWATEADTTLPVVKWLTSNGMDTFNGTVTNNASAFNVFGAGGSGDAAVGTRMDEIAIYRKKLSQSELNSIFNSGKGTRYGLYTY